MSGGVGLSEVYLEVWQGVYILRGQKGYRSQKGTLGAHRGVGAIRRTWGSQGCQGCIEVAGGLEPDHTGPQSRVPAFPLVPLGE